MAFSLFSGPRKMTWMAKGRRGGKKIDEGEPKDIKEITPTAYELVPNH